MRYRATKSVGAFLILVTATLMTSCVTTGAKCSWYSPLGKPTVDIPEDYLRKIKENELYYYENC